MDGVILSWIGWSWAWAAGAWAACAVVPSGARLDRVDLAGGDESGSDRALGDLDEASRVAVRLDCLGGGFKVLRAIVKTQ